MPPFYKIWFYRAKLKLVGQLLMKPQPRPLTFVGPRSAEKLSRAIGEFGIRKLLIVTDKPLRELGALEPTIVALQSHGVAAVIYDGVLPDPTAQIVDAGIAQVKAESCDAVLAIGGGSSIDCAKVIALAAANNYSVAECIGVNKCKLPTLPFFSIPTTAGTGSEATCIAVISDNDTHAKGAVIDNKIIPRATALDPLIMQGLPPHITAATGMDALTHAIESYIGTLGNEDTDFFGLAAAKLVFEHLPEACSNGDNLAAREAMAMASYYGGMAITQALVGYVHAISHNLGARYGVPHGLGNAMVLPHVLERLKDDAQESMARIAIHAGIGTWEENPDLLAQKLIDRIWQLNEQIGIPATTDVIKSEDIEELVDAALSEGSSYPTPRYFGRDECRQIIEQLRSA